MEKWYPLMGFPPIIRWVVDVVAWELGSSKKMYDFSVFHRLSRIFWIGSLKSSRRTRTWWFWGETRGELSQMVSCEHQKWESKGIRLYLLCWVDGFREIRWWSSLELEFSRGWQEFTKSTTKNEQFWGLAGNYRGCSGRWGTLHKNTFSPLNGGVPHLETNLAIHPICFFLILYIIISVFSLQKIYPGPPIYCTILVVLIHPLFPFTSQIDLYHHIPTIATHICFKMPYIPTYSNDLNHSFFVH